MKPRCVVAHCRQGATELLPLPDADPFDLPVCAQHHEAIAAEPGAWRLTSIPVRGKSGAYRTIVERAA